MGKIVTRLDVPFDATVSIVAVSMILAVTSGTSVLAGQGSWPLFGGNEQHTGVAPSSLDLNSGSVKWIALSEYRSIGWMSPVVGEDGTVYVCDGRSLKAVNPSGMVKWDVRISGDLSFTPAIGSAGNIHVGSRTGIVTVSESGQFVWNFTTDTPVVCPPTVDNDGRVYFGQDYGPSDAHYFLYCVLPNGTLAWEHEFGPLGFSSPAIGYDGIVYAVGGANSSRGSPCRLTALYPNGTIFWDFELNSSVESSPVVADDTIYVGTDDARLFAIRNDGELRWTFEARDSITATAAVALDGTIYIGSSDGYLYSLRSNGSLSWMMPFGILEYAHPVVGGEGDVLFGTHSSLFAVMSNGTVKWELDMGTDVYSPAIGADGIIYVGTYSGGLVAVGGHSGIGVDWFVFGLGIGVAVLVVLLFVAVGLRRRRM